MVAFRSDWGVFEIYSCQSRKSTLMINLLGYNIIYRQLWQIRRNRKRPFDLDLAPQEAVDLTDMDSDFESNFKRGRYTECVTLLKRSNDQKKFHIDEWAREQNLAICRYLKRSQAEVQLQVSG